MPSWTNPFGNYRTEGVPFSHASPEGLGINYRVDPRLFQNNRNQQFAQLGQQAVDALQGYMRQRTNDNIANTLLAAQQQGRMPTPSELANAEKTFAKNIPDLGGQKALDIMQQLKSQQDTQAASDRKSQIEDTNNYYKWHLDQANLDKLNAPNGPSHSFTIPGTNQTVQASDADILSFFKSHNQASDPNSPMNQRRQQLNLNDMGKALAPVNRVLAPYGVPATDLAQIDTTTPNVVKYVDAQGNPLSNEQAQSAAPFDKDKNPAVFATGQGPHGSFRVPYQQWMTGVSQYQDVVNRAKGIQQSAAPQPANDPLAQARAAISAGADPDAVRRRLQDNGIDPSGL